jgi:rhodanese-related sulfurtransferase
MQANQLWQNRDQFRWIDVRTPGEFASEHIEGSENIPLDQLQTRTAELKASSKPLIVVCRSGQRADKACQFIETLPEVQAQILEGGITAWQAQKLPLERGQGTISLERQVRIVAGFLAASGALLALFVDPRFALIPAFVGSGLVFAGVTDTCGMAMMLAKLPYNQKCGGKKCS